MKDWDFFWRVFCDEFLGGFGIIFVLFKDKFYKGNLSSKIILNFLYEIEIYLEAGPMHKDKGIYTYTKKHSYIYTIHAQIHTEIHSYKIIYTYT